jgi:hypothetical protein
MGSWFVSQGYGGTITHKGDWGQALDFVIHDDDHKTYRYPGTRAEDFYCFGKPVLACGDGVVEELIDHIDDNEIGDINAKDNWGNSIVIRHTGGLYSKVSHLKKNSAKVKYGDFVKQGDIIGLCGNSGRSPEPHLHFQLQATAYIGSKTLAYPFSYYISQLDDEKAFNSYQIPQEGMVVKSLSINSPLKRAFNFQPGAMVKVVSGSREEIIEVQTDDLNQTYLYSRSTRCVAYFINNGTSFYFTAFYGNHSSLLYFFYLAAYKVVFTDDADNSAADVYPLQLLWAKPIRWVHDFVAPFYQFIKLNYQSNNQTENEKTIIHGKQYKTVFRHKKQTMHSTIMVEHGSIQGFRINFNGVKVEAECIAENTY